MTIPFRGFPWSDAHYWAQRFKENDTPWQLPSPSLVIGEACRALEADGVSFMGRSVFIPGCGLGHEVAMFLDKGAHVTALDWNSDVVATLRTTPRFASLPSGSVKLECGDFFSATPVPHAFAVEHTFLCALDPDMRASYAENIARWIEPEGTLIGNFFVVSEKEMLALPRGSLTRDGNGPPFAITSDALCELLRPYFEKIVLRRAEIGESNRREGIEWVGIFRKRV